MIYAIKVTKQQSKKLFCKVGYVKILRVLILIVINNIFIS